MEHFSPGPALISLTSVLVLGIGAQWLAWRLHLPSILLLLVLGILAGPVTGFLDPDALFGDLLVPIVSVSVGIILFEGGLGLRFSELHEIRNVVGRLVTVGALVTWGLAAAGARWMLGLPTPLALLLGAVLVVTGPTVILPLLRHVRPTGQVASTLKWEGIVIDPVGATLSLLVFETILVGWGSGEASVVAFTGAARTIIFGGGLGAIGAFALVVLLRRYWIPDFLHETVTLMMVVLTFTASHLLQEESGLLATTVMGVVLANQRRVTVRHIVEFKENLGVLIISSIFILLAARLQASQLQAITPMAVVFTVLLIVVVRPACVAVSTLGSKLSWRERIFLAAMAPRGIVAASVASVFALRMSDLGWEEADNLVPLTFLVIIGTVSVYSLSATPLARRLKLSEKDPQGVLFVGAHSWARKIALFLKQQGLDVLLVDTNWDNIQQARMAGLPTHYGSILAPQVLEELPLSGLGRLLALTPNDEANSLAALQCSELFGTPEIYQLFPMTSTEKSEHDTFADRHLRGRFLFRSDATFANLSSRFGNGAILKRTNLTEEFTFEEFKARYGDTALPMFLWSDGRLSVFTVMDPPEPRPGRALIALVDPIDE